MERKLLIVTFLLVGINASLLAQSGSSIPKFRFSVSGGLGYLTAIGKGEADNIINKEKIRQHDNNLRLLTNLNGDAHYYFKSGFGFGTKYIFHRTSATTEGVIYNPYDGVHYVVTDIKERDYLNYVGLSGSKIFAFGNTNTIFLTTSVSTGYMWWRSEYSMNYQNILATSGNIAMSADVGLDYMFHRNLGVGVNLGSFLSFLYNIKETNGMITQEQELESDSWINVSNINISIGLRYYINR